MMRVIVGLLVLILVALVFGGPAALWLIGIAIGGYALCFAAHDLWAFFVEKTDRVLGEDNPYRRD